ncbi:phage tail protein [Phytoactinopolyspora alkaliphila]|uniref:Phage tail protein n=1 Tax=Phytoactinopolyspora alkaliphila TaxID=1783498 RepID=A0A6N9YFP2_9ACTN|nr:phage tail protein [Phytoactinopolyspora alkaliphila]
MRDAQFLGGEPTSANRFLFEVDGVEIGVFREVSGLQVTAELEEYAEGGENGYVHRLPGRLRWPNLVFRRGLTQSDALFAWVNRTAGEGFAAASNRLVRCTGAVTVLSDRQARLRAWEFDGVFAVRWVGPQFDVDSDRTLEEELEVAHNGFRSKSAAGAQT